MGIDVALYAEARDPEAGRWRKIAGVGHGHKSRELEYIVTGYGHRYAAPGIFSMPTLEDALGPLPAEGDSGWEDLGYAKMCAATGTGATICAGTLDAGALLGYPWEDLGKIPKHSRTARETMPSGFFGMLDALSDAKDARLETRVIWELA